MPPIRAPRAYVVHVFPSRPSLHRRSAQLPGTLPMGRRSERRHQDFWGTPGNRSGTDRLEVVVAGRVMTRRVMGMLAFFTLADVEKRYRQRYLDLIVSPHTRETLRRWCEFLEIETPVLQSVPSNVPFPVQNSRIIMS